MPKSGTNQAEQITSSMRTGDQINLGKLGGLFLHSSRFGCKLLTCCFLISAFLVHQFDSLTKIISNSKGHLTFWFVK